MYGFMACSDTATNIDSIKKQYGNFAEWGGYYFCYKQMPRFEQDHIFGEYEIGFILLDGVITNKTELMNDYGEMLWPDVFCSLIKEYGKDAVDKLRGSFCGIIGLKKNNELIVFTDQIGSKIVLYTVFDNDFFVASHASLLSEAIELDGKHELSFCIASMYELLTTSGILDDRTPFNEVRRVTAGKRLIHGPVNDLIEEYHVFRNVPEYEMDIDECIEKADILFRNAVDRIFGKNVEYGYRHECDLSGGLDSRMATWVAHDLGYENIINICYSVNNSLDHKISKRIAGNLGNDYYFLPMDAHIVYDSIDERVELSSGQIFYLLSTGGYEAVNEVLKSNSIGICCTGLLGEIQNAYWIEGGEHTSPKYISNRRSYFLDYSIDDSLSEQYDNYEQMNLYEYSCKTFLLSGLVRQQMVEVLSPFCDTDYLDYVYRIPLKWRKDYGFIQRYMCKKYPKAASYVWQKYRMPVINHYEEKPYLPKTLGTIRKNGTRVINKIFRILNISKAITYQDDMNPFQAWYKNSCLLRKIVDDYYNATIDLVPDERLKNDMKRMYSETDAAMDKFLVINALSIIKQYGRTKRDHG